MNDSTLWWVLAGSAVGIELLTGTFYLLMIAIGLAAAAVAAHLGLPLTTQLVVAALVGGVAVAVLHYTRGLRPAPEPANRNRDVNLDIGSAVHVSHWRADGTAHVKYRGAEWAARLVGGDAADAHAGSYTIREISGNCLILEK